MSKFQSTISTVAALVSIFGAGAAGWKLAQDSQTNQLSQPQQSSEVETKLSQLEQRIEEVTIPQAPTPELAPQEDPKETNPTVVSPPLPPAPPVVTPTPVKQTKIVTPPVVTTTTTPPPPP